MRNIVVTSQPKAVSSARGTVECPDRSISIRLQRGLAQMLGHPLRELLELSGFCDFLAVYTVLLRHRPAGRIIVPRCDVDRVQFLINESGVRCRRASFDLLKTHSSVRGTDHVARPVVGNQEANGVLYFGITDVSAEAAELATITQNHRLVGHLFAYPECCVSFYEQARNQTVDPTPLSIPSAGPFRAEMNPVTPHLYRPLSFLFHFPCSPDCQSSIRLRKAHQACVEAIYPDIAEVSELHAGIALYGERLGIGLITSYSELIPGCFRVQRAVSADPFIHNLFSDPDNSLLRIAGSHDFQIGNTAFAGPGDFAAVFC
jgi:hypothetical protein